MWRPRRLTNVDESDPETLEIDEVARATLEDSLHFHHLPPTVLGAGCTTLAHKFHAVSHSVFLEAGDSAESFAAFHREVAVGTFDLGTEMALPRVLPVAATALFPWAFRREVEELLEGEVDTWQAPSDGQPSETPHAALGAPGLLHIIHNAGSDLLEVITGLDDEVTRLMHVADLVRGAQTCERLIETCYSTEVGKCFHQ